MSSSVTRFGSNAGHGLLRDEIVVPERPPALLGQVRRHRRDDLEQDLDRLPAGRRRLGVGISGRHPVQRCRQRIDQLVNAGDSLVEAEPLEISGNGLQGLVRHSGYLECFAVPAGGGQRPTSDAGTPRRRAARPAE